MIPKTKGEAIFSLIFMIIVFSLLAIRGIQDTHEYQKEMEFLEFIQNLEGSEIKKVVVYDHVGSKSENVFNREFTDFSEITYFAECLNETIPWKPNHPLHYQSFDVVLFLTDKTTVTFDFSLLRSGEKNVHIYYFENGINASFQNKMLYNWLNTYGLIDDI